MKEREKNPKRTQASLDKAIVTLKKLEFKVKAIAKKYKKEKNEKKKMKIKKMYKKQ